MAGEVKSAAEGATPAEGAEEEAKKGKLGGVMMIPIVVLAYGGILLASWTVTDAIVVPQISRVLIEKEKALLQVEGSEEGSATDIGEIIIIEDLVVNPAQSNGSRYVAASIGFETYEPGMAEEIEKRNPQIKDFLIRALGSRTVEELTNVEARESLRAEIQAEVEEMLPGKSIKSVYFVNFVLQ